MNESATMQGARVWESKHRFCEISKCENGFVVAANYPIERKDKYSSAHERRKFVFADLSDLIAFVNRYLTVDRDELI